MNGIELQGLPELKSLFDELPKKFTDRVIKQTARKGAAVIKNAARRAMPFQLGDIGEAGKKAVVVQNSKSNPAAVVVTIGGNLVTINNKTVSVGKIIRHMTAGPQKARLRGTSKGRVSTGKVKQRYGDFIDKAFQQSKDKAAQVMKDDFNDLLQKAWHRR